MEQIEVPEQTPSHNVSVNDSGGSEVHDIDENKDLAAFSYLWIMSVVVFLTKRKSPFIRYHSKQAIVLFLLSIMTYFIPVIGRFLELIVLVGMVYGFLAAAQGQKKDVPIIGPLSRGEITVRQAWQRVIDFFVSIWKNFSSKNMETESSVVAKQQTSAPGQSSARSTANKPVNQ